VKHRLLTENELRIIGLARAQAEAERRRIAEELAAQQKKKTQLGVSTALCRCQQASFENSADSAVAALGSLTRGIRRARFGSYCRDKACCAESAARALELQTRQVAEQLTKRSAGYRLVERREEILAGYQHANSCLQRRAAELIMELEVEDAAEVRNYAGSR
jgi:hypothetical protein